MLGDPRQFLPGYQPHGVRELAIGTALGWPWLGTTLALMPIRLGSALTALACTMPRRDPLVLELHAIDLCEAADGLHADLVRSQPDLKVALADKVARIDAAMAALASSARPLASWL